MSFSKKKYLDMKCEETGNKAEMCTQGTRKALQFQQTSKAEDLLWQDPNPKYIQTRLKKIILLEQNERKKRRNQYQKKYEHKIKGNLELKIWNTYTSSSAASKPPWTQKRFLYPPL